MGFRTEDILFKEILPQLYIMTVNRRGKADTAVYDINDIKHVALSMKYTIKTYRLNGTVITMSLI
ncbi:hypothetical protein D3C74_361540 [compost metagenome]